MDDSDGGLWRLVTATNEGLGQTLVIRIRVAKPARPDVQTLTTAIVLSWPFARGARESVSAQQDDLERALDPLSEDDNSHLVQVSTGDDLREWLYYARSRDVFIERMNTLLAGHPRYPVQISFYDDPDWQEWGKTIEALGARGAWSAPRTELFLGWTFSFKNAPLAADYFGSPHEVLTALREQSRDPRALAAAVETEIAANEVYMEKPKLEIDGDGAAADLRRVAWFVRQGQLDQVSKILRKKPGLLAHDSDAAGVPLVAAVWFDSPDAVDCLLQHRARVDAPIDLGMTALHWASVAGRAQLVERLLEAGADSTQRSWFLLDARELARLNRHDIPSLGRMGDPDQETKPSAPSVELVLRRMGCLPVS